MTGVRSVEMGASKFWQLRPRFMYIWVQIPWSKLGSRQRVLGLPYLPVFFFMPSIFLQGLVAMALSLSRHRVDPKTHKAMQAAHQALYIIRQQGSLVLADVSIASEGIRFRVGQW